MNRLQQLKRRAEGTAGWREHQLGPWEKLDSTSARAVCRVCGAQAVVDTDPPANGIDVMGEAVATYCVG